MMTFSSAPLHVRPRHKATGLASASKRKSTVFSRGRTQLTDFFQIPPNPQRTLLLHDVIHIPKSYLEHLWTTHPPHVYVNSCAQVCTKLTHVLSREVLSLTKPKGKIYKTKSLGHYITFNRLSFNHTVNITHGFRDDNIITIINNGSTVFQTMYQACWTAR